MRGFCFDSHSVYVAHLALPGGYTSPEKYRPRDLPLYTFAMVFAVRHSAK